MTTELSQPFASLRSAQFMVLTTYRKSGVAVPTTVWFAEDGGKLYVYTPSTAGKLKRIRNNPRVTVEASDRVGKLLGPAIEATARILPASEERIAEQAFDRKYGWRRRVFHGMARLAQRLRGRSSAGVYLEIASAA